MTSICQQKRKFGHLIVKMIIQSIIVQSIGINSIISSQTKTNLKTILTFLAICCINMSNAQFISEDDALHFGAGALISGTTYAIVYSKTKNKKKAFWYSLGTATLAGLTKELFDEFIFDGRFDTGEMVATSLGGFVVSTTFNIFTGKRKKKKKKQLAFMN